MLIPVCPHYNRQVGQDVETRSPQDAKEDQAMAVIAQFKAIRQRRRRDIAANVCQVLGYGTVSTKAVGESHSRSRADRRRRPSTSRRIKPRCAAFSIGYWVTERRNDSQTRRLRARVLATACAPAGREGDRRGARFATLGPGHDGRSRQARQRGHRRGVSAQARRCRNQPGCAGRVPPSKHPSTPAFTGCRGLQSFLFATFESWRARLWPSAMRPPPIT